MTVLTICSFHWLKDDKHVFLYKLINGRWHHKGYCKDLSYRLLCNHNRKKFWGDVALNSFRDVDSILDQMYRKANMLGVILWRFRILWLNEENAHLKKYSTLQQGTHKIGFQCCPNVSMHFRIILNHHNKYPNIFSLCIFGLKCCLYP